MIFRAYKSEGAFNWFEIDQYLETLRDGIYSITIEKWNPKRSGQQNRYYWGAVLRMISDETGHTTEELHEFFRKKFLEQKMVTVGFEKVEIRPSTTSLTTAEFSDYTENIRMFAAETLGLNIPDPGEQ